MAECGKGYKYQLSVTAYLASLLSKKRSVEDYRIFYEVKEVNPFDDIVVAVEYNGSQDIRLYLIQVKSGKIRTLDIEKYQDGYDNITRNKKWNILNDNDKIDEKNIQFWYFACEGFSEGERKAYQKDLIRKKLRLKELKYDRSISIIDDKYTEQYKLCLENNNIRVPTEDQDFFDNYYIYLRQLNEREILRKLERMWKLNYPEQVIHYLEQYLITNKNKCLNKTAFEQELLRIRLLDYMVRPIKVIPVKKEPAHAWINLTLTHHVTIIENTLHAEACLFGCIVSKIGDTMTVDEWNECAGNESKLSERIKENISSDKFKPRTLKDLVTHFWMSNKIPLILKAEDDLPALKEFSHLNQHYIVIDSKLKKRCDEMKSYKLSVIKDLGGLKADELLQSISVSLQGRKPTSLYEVINGDKSLLETLTCSDVLKLMEPKRVYLKDECFEDGSNMLFIIEEYREEEYVKTSKNNILMYCPRNRGDECYQKAVQDSHFKDYKIYRLYAQDSESEEQKYSLRNKYRLKKQQLIEARNIAERNSTEEYRGLEYFFVDQHGDNVYRENEDKIVPIIGEIINTSCPRYLSRRMRKITTKHGQNRSSTDNNLNSVNEYTEKSFSENDFFIKTTRKLCVVTGKGRIGKSTFLRSLVLICNLGYYVLFYDLALYQADLYDQSRKQSELCRNPLNFLCSKHNSLPYNKFLSKLKKDSKRLIIILDSLDEVIEICEENVLKLIDKLNQEPCLNKIIVGSRSPSLLSNQFDVDLVEIDGLDDE